MAVGTTTVAGPAKLTHVSIVPAAADSTVIVYDGPAASAVVLASLKALANGAGEVMTLTHPIQANTSLVAVVVGTGAVALMGYQTGN